MWEFLNAHENTQTTKKKKTSFNKKARNNALHQDLDNDKKRKFKRKKEEIDKEKKASFKFLLFFLFKNSQLMLLYL